MGAPLIEELRRNMIFVTMQKAQNYAALDNKRIEFTTERMKLGTALSFDANNNAIKCAKTGYVCVLTKLYLESIQNTSYDLYLSFRTGKDINNLTVKEQFEIRPIDERKGHYIASTVFNVNANEYIVANLNNPNNSSLTLGASNKDNTFATRMVAFYL